MKRYGKSKKNQEQGYTLLEYCAGAAIIIGVVWGALNTLGGNMSVLIGNIADWAKDRGDDIANGNVGLASGGSTGGTGNGTANGNGNGNANGG